MCMANHKILNDSCGVLRQKREAVLKTVVAQSGRETLLSACPSEERLASGVGHGRHRSGISSPASDDRDDGRPGGSDCARPAAAALDARLNRGRFISGGPSVVAMVKTADPPDGDHVTFGDSLHARRRSLLHAGVSPPARLHAVPQLQVEIAHAIRAHGALLDGEIVCLAPDGRSMFNRLRFRRDWPYFVAFDVLVIDGEDLRRGRSFSGRAGGGPSRRASSRG